MRPTRGVAAAVAMAGVLYFLARTTEGGWLLLASGACLALPVAALLLRPRLDGVQVVSDPVHARVGEQVDVRLVLRNGSRRPSPPLRLTDRTDGLSPLVVAVPALRPGAEVAAVLRRTATRRGWLPSSTVRLSSSAPFGLIHAERDLAVPGPFVVAPRPVPAGELRAASEGTGGSSRPVGGIGTEVLGLRAWRPGDGARALSARASARHGRPVVLERERDTGATVVVLCAGPGGGPAWEQALERSCAIAEEAVRRGRPPVLLAAGLDVPARPGLGAVLDWHACLDRAGALDVRAVTTAVRSAGPGGALVLLAPSRDAHVGEVARSCAAAGVALTVLGPT